MIRKIKDKYDPLGKLFIPDTIMDVLDKEIISQYTKNFQEQPL